MKLQAIKNMVTSKVARQVLVGRKHAPVILFGAGVVGVVATAVLASRATLKLDSILVDTQEDLEKIRTTEHASYSEQDRQKDIAIVYGRTTAKIVKLYALPAAVGILSITALTGSHVVLTRRNTAVMAAYAALDRGFKEYRQRVQDEFGVEKEREIRYAMTEREIVEETDEGAVTKRIKQAGIPTLGGGYGLFFDETCGSANYSKDPGYNQSFLSNTQNWANDMLRAKGHVFLNDIFDMLGVQRTKAGSVVGWLDDGEHYISFGVFENDLERAKRFITGMERSVLLDFNVQGVIWDKI